MYPLKVKVDGNKMAKIYSGRCLCGNIKFETNSEPIWTALCHCESCRRACSAPLVAWMSFKDFSVKWLGQRTFYKSSENGTRGFCGQCGTQMSFVSARWKDQIHLYATSLNNPESYEPSLHCYYSEKLNWLSVNEDLPKFGSPAPT